MLCKICGAQIPDDADVCEFCGAQLSEEEAVLKSENSVIENAEDKNDNFSESDSYEETEEKDGEELFDDNERRRRAQMEKMLADKKQQVSEIEKRRN